jgi:hypothetical protein
MVKNQEKLVYIPAIGAVPQLVRESSKDWSRFRDKLQFYFQANFIQDEVRQKAILIGCTGDLVYDLLMKCKSASMSIHEISLKQSYKVLEKYFNPEINKYLQLQLFGARIQPS